VHHAEASAARVPMPKEILYPKRPRVVLLEESQYGGPGVEMPNNSPSEVRRRPSNSKGLAGCD